MPEKLPPALARPLYLLARLVFGIVSGVGVVFTAWFGPVLVLLLTGRIQPDLDVPDVTGAATLFGLGLAHLILGAIGPRWLRVDKLLE